MIKKLLLAVGVIALLAPLCAAQAATIYLQKINPRTSLFDYYASSPAASNSVTPAGLQSTNSASSGQVPSKAAGGDYFTWVNAGAGSGVAAGDTTTWTGGNTFLGVVNATTTTNTFGGDGSLLLKVSSITLSSMFGAPTLVGTNFTSLPGAQVGSGVPAANIAAGSLGTSVLASSITLAAMFGKPTLDGTNFSNVANSSLDSSSVTKQGPIVSSITLASMFGAPTITGGNITALNASQLTAGTVPIARLNQGADFWYDDSARTWTGLGSTTFTVNADMTAILNPGDPLKWTQSATVKYAYVQSVAFTAAVSTVTIFVSTDYTLVAGAMTSQFYSKSVKAAGFPHVFNSTATYTGFSVNPVPSTYRYWVDGHQVFINIYCTTNGTSNATTLTIAGPVTSKNATAGASGLNEWAGTAGVVNNSALASTFGAWSVTSNSTTINFYTSPAGAAWTGSGTKCAQVMPIIYEY